ncbi:TetR/AcrR family transcriptional regulator [Streptomyces olivoreticuli]
MTGSRSYHHGDLRRAVMAAALEVIAADGPAAISLRDLARRAGVSHAAPAHHFKDRAGLLTAIAAEGYGLLADVLADVPCESPDALRELGVRYVRFAVDHPAHFEVMHRPHLHHPDDPELVAARDRAWRLLSGGVDALPAAGRGSDARTAALAAWSLAHGFATLHLNGGIGGSEGVEPTELFRRMAELIFVEPATGE